jgi:hypothetical protein
VIENERSAGDGSLRAGSVRAVQVLENGEKYG